MKLNVDFDVNSWTARWAAIFLGTVGVLSFIVQPGLVQGFVTELGLSELQANNLAFAEMLGMALGTVATIFLTRTVNWRKVLFGAILIAVVGNVLSAIWGSPDLLKFSRFFTGLGAGAITGLSFTIVGMTNKPERNIAYYLVLLLTYGAVGLWAMPTAFATIGLKGIFIFWAVVTLLALLTVKHVPTSSDSRVVASPTAAQLKLPFLLLALAGILVYNSAIGLAWANLFLIGMDIRPDEQAIANALLLAQFIAIPGALIAALMSDKIGRWIPLVLGIFGGAAFIAYLRFDSSYLPFVIGVCGFNFMWNMVLPFILAAVGDMDEKSRMVTPAIAMQMVGIGFGPFFAAILLGQGGGFKAIESLTVILLLISFVMIVIPMLVHKGALAKKLNAATDS